MIVNSNILRSIVSKRVFQRSYSSSLSKIANKNNGFQSAIRRTSSKLILPTSQQNNLLYFSTVNASTNESIEKEQQNNNQKGVLSRAYEKYSISGQQRRIKIGERLFRAAQSRASNPLWYNSGHIANDFRSRHAVLTMHIWLLNQRLIIEANNPQSVMDKSFVGSVQEELFDILWYDTTKRIRAEGLQELTVNKNLQAVQLYTFQHLTHYDHCFSKLLDKPDERYETLGGLVWRHIFLQQDNEEQKDDNSDNYNSVSSNKDNAVSDDQIERIVSYVEYQYNNICECLPDKSFAEGRVNWGKMNDLFVDLKDNNDNLILPLVSSEGNDDKNDITNLPEGWTTNLTDTGDTYYWNYKTMKSSWKRPSQ